MHIEVQLGPDAWTDITADVLVETEEITFERGNRTAGPVDLVADPGVLNFVLGNRAETNTGETLGWYSPENANRRPGWAVGIGCRLSYWISGTPYYLFTGWVENIDPELERHNEVVRVLATDYMLELTRHTPIVATLTNTTADEVMRAVVEGIPKQPAAMDFEVGDSEFEFALDNVGKQKALAVGQRTMESEFGRLATLGDGTLRLLSRSARLSAVAEATFSDDMTGFRAVVSRRQLLTKVRARTHPRRVGATNTETLASYQGHPPVAPGETIVLKAAYSDPNDPASRVGGKDFQPPTAPDDYEMTANEDGSGADLTAFFSVLASNSATEVEWRVTNNGVTQGYIQLLQTRGRSLKDYDHVDSPASADTDTIKRYGENELVLDMAFLSDQNVAQAVADYLIETRSTPGAVEAELQFFASKDATYLGYALTLDIGRAIGVVETATGVSNLYFIVGVSGRFVMGKKLWTTWILERALATNFFQLDQSELDGTEGLAPL